ncbi:hypothetical protein NHX12_019840 [Muraenolepis orangiensis]|uniref:Homeobox domain-containing protein n=1 Tax=Muraenolepis orangiensis TaxID=630683 RepID=A0A9Q0EUR0_9TELE|nr:hypothetical protein NHX12_019840 [Muraenolepis orangiensis]
MFPPAGKRCFTIESLVGKESGPGATPVAASPPPVPPEEPVRPTALSYSSPGLVVQAADAFMSGYQVSPGPRSLYPNPELVFPETVSHHHHHHHPALSMAHPHPHPHPHHHHPLGGGGSPAAHHLHHPHFFSGPQPRDPLSFYPWVLRNRFFGHSDVSQDSLLLAHGPFARKPKRIRTAFSPSQLLRLERSFEKNHYVVGAERKQLANGLSLSETQVKVWFQNRRTKYKRQKLEEEGPDQQQRKKGNHHINRWRLATKQASSEDIDVTSED